MNANSESKSFLYRTFAVCMIALLALAAMPAATVFAAPSYGHVDSVSLGAQVGNHTYGTTTAVQFAVTVTESGLLKANTTLSAVGLPSGATASFSPVNPLQVDQTQNVTVTINITAAAGAGSYTFHIRSSDGPIDSGNQNLVILKATPVLSVTNSPVIYNATARAATVSANVAGVLSNILTGGAATKTNSGGYNVTANFVPTSTANYNTLSGASAGNFIINKATPVLSVTNSPVIYNATGQAATVSAAVTGIGSVPGVASSILTGGSATKTTVGTYAVTASFTPTDTTNYNSPVAAAAGNFLINKATPTLSVTNSPATYDGFGHLATVTGSVSGVVSNVLTGLAATQTNAATYTVKANFIPTDTTNYNSRTGAATTNNFTINPATSTTTVTGGTFTYDRSAHPATVSVTGAGGLNLTPAPVYGSSCSAAPITVAEGTTCSVGYSYGGDANHTASSDTKTITITPVGLSVSGVTANNKVYDGTTNDNGFSGGTLTGILSPDVVTLNSNSASGAFNSKDVGTGISVGSISGFTLSGADAGNYILLAQPIVPNANITLKTVTVSNVAANNKAYDGTTDDNGFTGGTLTGIINPDNVVLAYGSGTFASKNVGTAISISASGFGLTGSAAANNYVLASQPSGITANITAIGLTTSGVSADNKEYDGTAVATLNGTATPVGVLFPDIVTIGGTPVATFSIVSAANNIPVTVSGFTLGGADGSNYILTQPTGLSANITKATPVLYMTDSSVLFNNNPQSANVLVFGSIPGSINNILYNGIPTLPINLGSYTVTADFAPVDNANINSLNAAAVGVLVITDKILPTINAELASFVFDGNAHEAPIVVADSVAGVISNVRYNGSLTAPINVGSYLVTANFTPTDTGTYGNLVNASADFIFITKATPTLSITNSPVGFDGTAHAANVSGSTAGLVSNILYDGSPTAPTDVGAYAVTANFAPSSSNYFNLTNASAGAFVINPTSASSSAAANDGWVLESKEISSVASTQNANGKLRAGDDAYNRQYRSLLFFDTSDIPDNADVSKVIVKIYKSNVTGIDPFTTHGDLVADIKKGFFGLSPLELTDFNAAAEPINTAGRFRDIGSNWFQLNLSSSALKYINVFGATQFRIRFVLDDNNDKTANIALFDSGSDVNPPQLIVEYSLP